MVTETQGEDRRHFHRVGLHADAWLKLSARTISC
jgi:hypothetical protein